MSNAFDWRAKAACRDKDPELFFPVGNTGAAYNQIEEAKAVCRTCKVIDACLKCALDTNQDYGVWGGLSEDERRALKRRAMRRLCRCRSDIFACLCKNPPVWEGFCVRAITRPVRHAASYPAPHGYRLRGETPSSRNHRSRWSRRC